MKKTTALLTLSALAMACQMAAAADITGTVTLKGTPPKEKEITPLKDDPTCGKMHKEPVKTRFYVVGENNALANVFVYIKSGLPEGKKFEPKGEPMLDLAYVEDSRADVDMNVVKTGAGLYIELQGTAEALPFGREALNRLLDLADTGIRQLIALQRGLVGQYLGKS